MYRMSHDCACIAAWFTRPVPPFRSQLLGHNYFTRRLFRLMQCGLLGYARTASHDAELDLPHLSGDALGERSCSDLLYVFEVERQRGVPQPSSLNVWRNASILSIPFVKK